MPFYSAFEEDDWRGQILNCVEQVESYGTAGSLVVWGDNAQVILTQAFNPQHVLLVAAEQGAGRVVIFTNVEYVSLFNKNIPSKVRCVFILCSQLFYLYQSLSIFTTLAA